MYYYIIVYPATLPITQLTIVITQCNVQSYHLHPIKPLNRNFKRRKIQNTTNYPTFPIFFMFPVVFGNDQQSTTINNNQQKSYPHVILTPP